MLLLTRHVALRKVSEELSIPHIQQSIGSLAAFLKTQCHIEKPNLCILGVNPHAGEIDGDEEERILKPALKLISEKYGFGIEPPKPADAAFRHFDIDNLQYDAFVAAYHDQGLIPFKMVAGLSAVNVTIGLPFLRTSVSHGTAPDIVGQGLADPASLIAAYELALSFLPKTVTA
jgi:4-hydroxythreonine-4-phosphate dehydrogenase